MARCSAAGASAGRSRGVGIIAVGSIFYFQDNGFWRARFGAQPVPRNPWIVEAFLNGELRAARRDPRSGSWMPIVMGNQTDTALLR